MTKARALIFDVFGTLVDWRGSIARESRLALEPLGLSADWHLFADQWRAEYQPAMEEVRAGRIAFCKLDVLHRRNLDVVLARHGFHQVDEATRVHLNLAWHRLDAWPDVTPALARLKGRFRLAPCSNGNVALMVDLARRNRFPWDAILGAEFAGDYKPQPVVYRASARAFSDDMSDTMMVAAHGDDLAAAAKVGLRTAYVARPDEYGPGRGELEPPTSPPDATARDLMHLADQFGC
jgi:2-haloacid dehalogenase